MTPNLHKFNCCLSCPSQMWQLQNCILPGTMSCHGRSSASVSPRAGATSSALSTLSSVSSGSSGSERETESMRYGF